MKHSGKIWIKTAALWLVLMIGQVAGGALFFHGAPASPALAKDGPLDVGQALLASNAVDAVILAALACAMRLRGLKLGLTLATVFFALECGLSAIEIAMYRADVHMSPAALRDYVALGLLRSVLAGAAIAFMWRGDARGEARKLPGLVWKFPLIAALYVVCYWTAGYEIAWKSAAVRAYYANLAQHYSFGLILPLQFGRGLVWCALAWLLARSLAGPPWRTALLTGLAFSLVMAMPLLYPNLVMPWPVRAAHFSEILSSNLVFGAIAALILLGGAKRAPSGAIGSAAAAPAC